MDIEKVDIENMDIEPHPVLVVGCTILNAIVTFLLKFMCNAFRFGMYLVNLTLILLSNLIEKYCLENWDWYQNRLEYLSEDDSDDEVVPVEVEFYNIRRSGDFDRIYNDLKSNISVTKDVELVLDEKVSKDIVNKVEKLVTIIESESIVEGYEFARDTECKISSNDVYKKYILKKILEG